MITGLQLAIAAGALVGAGAALLVWRLAPAHPDLKDTLARLSANPVQATGSLAAVPAAGDARTRLGTWATRILPGRLTGTGAARSKDLAILRVTSAAFTGERVLCGLLGLAIPPLLAGFLWLIGLPLPVPVPVAASLACGVLLFWLPGHNLAGQAKQARAEFARVLGAYIDLVALERAAGSGPRQAMETAAAVGDDWVFHRLAEELARSRWSGQPPWDALRGLADQLGVPDLADLADIMRLSGEEGAQVFANLRARSDGLRSALLHTELAAANETGERMSIPMSLLGVIFLAILIGPALLRILDPASP